MLQVKSAPVDMIAAATIEPKPGQEVTAKEKDHVFDEMTELNEDVLDAIWTARTKTNEAELHSRVVDAPSESLSRKGSSKKLAYEVFDEMLEQLEMEFVKLDEISTEPSLVDIGELDSKFDPGGNRGGQLREPGHHFEVLKCLSFRNADVVLVLEHMMEICDVDEKLGLTLAKFVGYLELGESPSSTMLKDCKILDGTVRKQVAKGRLYVAICAAHVVAVGSWTLLKGLKATCYLIFMEQLLSPASAIEYRVQNGIVMSHRPGTTMEYVVCLVELLYGKEKVDEVSSHMVLLSNHDFEYCFAELQSTKWTCDGSPKILVNISNGSEEMEAVIIIDVLRQEKAELVVVSVEDTLEIEVKRVEIWVLGWSDDNIICQSFCDTTDTILSNQEWWKFHEPSEVFFRLFIFSGSNNEKGGLGKHGLTSTVLQDSNIFYLEKLTATHLDQQGFIFSPFMVQGKEVGLQEFVVHIHKASITISKKESSPKYSLAKGVCAFKFCKLCEEVVVLHEPLDIKLLIPIGEVLGERKSTLEKEGFTSFYIGLGPLAIEVVPNIAVNFKVLCYYNGHKLPFVVVQHNFCSRHHSIGMDDTLVTLVYERWGTAKELSRGNTTLKGGSIVVYPIEDYSLEE